MFWDEPVTNPRTPQTTSDEPYEAYDPGHQVEMTPEEPKHDDQVEIVNPGHQVEMTYPTPSHQVEMAYPEYTSWYKPSNPDGHQVEMVKEQTEDHQVEMVPPPVPSHQVEMAPSHQVEMTHKLQTSGGGWIPPPRPRTMKSSNIPKMKGPTMKDLDKYNEDFKKFTTRLIRHMMSPEDTMKAYLHWLDLGLLKALKADGVKQKTLAGWQLWARIVLKRTEKEPKKTYQTPPLEQLKTGAKKLPRATHHQILKELALEGLLPTAIHCQVIGELAHYDVLGGQELAKTICHLNIDAMYIPKRQALKIKCNVVEKQCRTEIVALVNSGATENFIDQRTIKRLWLKTTALPQE